MLERHARFISILLVLMFLMSVIVVPMGHAIKIPKWLNPLWLIYTALEDVLSGIDRLIRIIQKDIKEMEDTLSETNDALMEEWYPKRKQKEKELEEAQKELDKLDAEHEAALTKKSNARIRVRSLKTDISQIKSRLAMLSPSESSQRAALEAQLAQKKRELADAEEDIEEADKIINSHWRKTKRSFYRYVIGDAFSGLTGELVEIRAHINTLETLADNLTREIKKKKQAETDETERRGGVAEDVRKARENYKNAKKKGNPYTEK